MNALYGGANYTCIAETGKPAEAGVVLGNPNVGRMVTEATAARDADLRPILEAMRDQTYREIAEALTDRCLKTSRGRDVWNPVAVMRAMRRLGIQRRRRTEI